jgi:hypothetical protein
MRAIPRLRKSPRFYGMPGQCGKHQTLWELASDGGGSGNSDFECAALIAGRPAPTGFVSGQDVAATIKPCGSWLASDGGVSGDIDVECAGLFAGKPAPTGFVSGQDDAASIKPCGSWLASDGGGSGNSDFECAALIAGRPAPTGSYRARMMRQP